MLKSLKTETVVAVFEPLEFPIYENKDLAYNLEVTELAKFSARNDNPNESAKRPDANEINFRLEIQNYAVQATSKMIQCSLSLREQIASISIKKEITEIESMGTELDSAVKADLAPVISELGHAKKQVVDAEQDISSFKKENGLRRTADYPESHVLTFAILVFALIIESILNGVFFAKGHDLGLVGGVSMALIIALLNIALGFITGSFPLRYKNHIKTWLSILGVATTVFFIGLAFVFNLLVSHYREALSIDPDGATTLAMKSFKEGILTLSDVQSWFLFLVGMIFFSLAVYKGYNFNDKYPGFGRIVKQRNQLLGELDDIRRNTQSDLEELHLEKLKRLEECYETIKFRKRNLGSMITSLETQMGVYRAHIRNLEGNLEFLVTLYRSDNSAERKAPRPVYFDDEVDNRFELEPINDDYSDKRKEISSEIEVLDRKLPELRANMSSLKEAFHSKIEEVTKI